MNNGFIVYMCVVANSGFKRRAPRAIAAIRKFASKVCFFEVLKDVIVLY